MKRAGILSAAVVLYMLVAWAVAPGFYDGFAPQSPYNWVKPPPQFTSNNKPAEPGSGSFKVGRNNAVDPGSAFTADGQASLSFVPGSFDPPPGGGSVIVEIKPEADFPDPVGIHFATNVYLITAGQPLVKEALVTLRFSDQVPAPSDIYYAPEKGAGWTKLGSTGSSAPFTIGARTAKLGYFAAGYPANSSQPASGVRIGGGQTLPIITAIVILIVVLAGVPLAVLRRRDKS